MNKSLFSLSNNMNQIKIAFLCFMICIPNIIPRVNAQGHLQQWHTHTREKSESYNSAALTALNKGNLSETQTLLLKAISAEPANPSPYNLIGLVYASQKKYSQALDSLKKSYQLKKQAETLISTGLVYYLQHDYDAAIKSFTMALDMSPQTVEVNADIAFAYMRKGDFARADEYFRKLIKAKPNSQIAYHGLALINYLAGNFDAAVKAASHAQSIQSYLPVQLLLAKLKFLQGDAKQAKTFIDEYLRKSSKKLVARSMTSMGYPNQHDFHWDPFLEDNFDNARLLSARILGNDKKSAQRKRSLTKSGRVVPLLEAANNAFESNSNDFYICRELALLELANGNYEKAAELFHKTLQLCPGCNVDWLHLAKVQSMLDKNAEASYAVREFQKLKPKQKIAQTFMELSKGEPATPSTSIDDDKPNTDGRLNWPGADSGF